MLCRFLVLVIEFLYVFSVYLFTALFFKRTGASTPNTLTLLLATVAVLASLPFVRRTVKKVVDHLLFASQADAYANASEFINRVSRSLAIDDVLPRLAETTMQSARAKSAQVRLWLSDGGEWQQAWPPQPLRSTNGAHGDLAIDVRHGGGSVGELEVEMDGSGNQKQVRRALQQLAAPAGTALSTVRMTLDLRQRIEQLTQLNQQLQASRQRLIDARRHEQMHLLDDVNAMVFPHLQVTTNALSAAVTALRAGDDNVEGHLEMSTVEIKAALDALRSLARGVFPPLLVTSGLRAALESWVTQSQVQVGLHISPDVDHLGRLPSAEAAIYFTCVTLVSSGASASTSAEITVLVEEGMIQTTVSGIEVNNEERVLQRVHDRLEAIGGSIVIELDPARVVASIPLIDQANTSKETLLS